MIAGVVYDFNGTVAEHELILAVLVSRILPCAEKVHVESSQMEVAVKRIPARNSGNIKIIFFIIQWIWRIRPKEPSATSFLSLRLSSFQL